MAEETRRMEEITLIVDPDFLTHWKTQALVEALDDHAAPVYVIALWSHCQLRRTDRFEGINYPTFAKICRYPFKGDAAAFFGAMKECGFVEVEGDTIVAHGWIEVNKRLSANWQNGKLRSAMANPQETHEQSKNGKVELGTLDREREDRIGKRGKDKSTPKPPKGALVLIPQTLEGKRVAALYGRKESTPWTKKEVEAFKTLFPFNDDELCMVERYYGAERAKRDSVCRKDLGTFLNNYRGEIDRARAWCELHPIRSKSVKFEVVEPKAPEWTEEQIAQNKAAFAQMTAGLTGGMKPEASNTGT